MIPDIVLSLAHEGLRLVNNLIEGTPMEARRLAAIEWYALWWPVVKPLLGISGVPPSVVQGIEDAMAKVRP